ncbi:reverse transcriptase [Trichonephila clavipes]|nr:reverse transcriptase [Trichonephila clavipes]
MPPQKKKGKPWETGHCAGPIPKHLERAKAVAHFRLSTGHDFLGVYLHRLGVAANEACPLYSYVRMDGDHLLKCTGLDSMNTWLMTSSIGTRRLSVKWSRSQAWVLDK